ncbi:MAG: glycosyltransferase family 4 protein [Magnetovibrionaceae bacterium]
MSIQPTRPLWLLLDSAKAGGIESHVYELSLALSERGFPVEVIFLQDHGDHPLKSRLTGAGVPWRSLGGPRTLAPALRRERPGLVHTHGYKAGILGRMACRLLGIPCCSTFHSGDPGAGRVRLYTTLDRLTAGWAPVMAVSDAIAEDLGGCPVPPNFIAPPQPVGPGRSIAFVGRFAEEKGADLLPSLALALPHRAFRAFGDGPLYRGVVRAGPPNLLFQGAVASMENHWDGIGLLVMPSRAEGLPMAALEAMGRGIPVAAFGVGALPGLLDQGRGWAVEPGNTASLVQALNAWDKEPPDARAQRAAKCRIKVLADHSPEAALSVILPVYEKAGLLAAPASLRGQAA